MGLTEKQLAIRRTGVTATDVVVLAGLPYYGRTVHDVWRSKVLGDEVLEETEAMSLGNELEPMIVRRLAAKRGLVVVPRASDAMTVVHATKPTHIATPDAFLARPALPVGVHSATTSIEALGQAKLIGAEAMRKWGPSEDVEQIPDPVLVQVAWELHVTGLPVDYVGALVGAEVRTYAVRLEDVEDLVGELEDVAERFMRDHVVTKKPPPVDGTAGAERMLRALHPEPTGPRRRAGPQTEAAARAYFSARAAELDARKAIARAKQELMSFCGGAAGIVGDGWRLKANMRAGYEVGPKSAYVVAPRRRFDCRAVKSKRKE
jgi:hypothetical protein